MRPTSWRTEKAATPGREWVAQFDRTKGRWELLKKSGAGHRLVRTFATLEALKNDVEFERGRALYRHAKKIARSAFTEPRPKSKTRSRR